MCGVFGLANFRSVTSDGIQEGPLNDSLDAMGEALNHRGPDDEGRFVDRRAGVSVGLGMRRLSIIDVMGGSQPIENENGSIVVICNGEIYNHQDLRQTLLSKGHRFRTRSDAEVIVHLYEEYGCECVRYLRGMFAFAVWDVRRQQLLLARDRLGIKPVFYYHDGQRFAFASEIRGLLPVLEQMPEIKRESLIRLLLLQYVPAPDTALEGIHKLHPGTILLASERGIITHRYWTLPTTSTADLHLTDEQLARIVRTRLREAIHCHLISDVPVGAFLSGGLDSTALVALMNREPAGLRSPTFSVGFEGPAQCSELDYARLAACRYGGTHHELIVTPGDVLNALSEIVKHLDEPLTDPAIVPTYLLSRFAAQHVKVVLTGEGADELFGGYRRYSLDRLVSWYHWLPPRLRAAVPRWLERHSVNRRIVQGLDTLAHPAALNRHLIWTGTFTHDELAEVVGTHLQLDSERERLEAFFRIYFQDTDVDHAVKGMMQADLATWLPDDLLAKIDRMSMAASLEARVPYLDHPLVELVAGIPVAAQFRRGRKTILKRAVGDMIPREILHRKKMGFEMPLASWMRGPLRDFVHDCLSMDGPPGFFRRAGVDRFLAQHLRGEQDRSRQLWSILMVKLWYHSVLHARVRVAC